MSSFARKMTVIMLIKLIALMGIYWLYFGPSHRVKVDPTRVQSLFYSGDVARPSGE